MEASCVCSAVSVVVVARWARGVELHPCTAELAVTVGQVDVCGCLVQGPTCWSALG